MINLPGVYGSLTARSEIHHLYDLVPELDDEADNAHGDDDWNHRYDEREEAGHEQYDAIDNWADGCIEIESHCLYILAEHCNNPYSIPRIFKCYSLLRRERKHCF